MPDATGIKPEHIWDICKWFKLKNLPLPFGFLQGAHMCSSRPAWTHQRCNLVLGWCLGLPGMIWWHDALFDIINDVPSSEASRRLENTVKDSSLARATDAALDWGLASQLQRIVRIAARLLMVGITSDKRWLLPTGNRRCSFTPNSADLEVLKSHYKRL